MKSTYWQICIILMVLGWCSVLVLVYRIDRSRVNNYSKCSQNSPTYKFRDHDNAPALLPIVLELSRDIAYAEKHARGMKTTRRLKTAMSKIRKTLSAFNVSYEEVTERHVQPAINICPEKYKGTKYGHPLYLKGFETIECGFGKSVDKLLTVVIVFELMHKNHNIEKTLMSLNKVLSGVKVIGGIHRSILIDRRKLKEMGNIALIFYDTESIGTLLNKAIKLVKTNYTLIANDVTEFDDNVRVERLIRELESLRVSAVSGAIRNFDGKWREGCYQRAFRNYTMSYFEGYDESIHECLVCDHIEGPFVIRTMEASTISFDESLQRNGLFEDFFIRLGEERSIVCPDSLFHVEKVLPKSNISTDWQSFANKYDLVKLKYNPGLEILFSCNKQQNCFKSKFYVAHPCCLQELGDMVKSTMQICDQVKSMCEIFAGTLMASIKLGQVLPWDIDGDVSFLTKNYSTFEEAARTFSKYDISGSSPNHNGYFQLNSKNWFVECWGFQKMTSEEYIKNGKGPTKVLLNGDWIKTNKNPGLHTRNRYGPEFFRHAIHWRYTGGKSSWLIYKPDSFPSCDVPGDHKCLDNFRTDGNLQFSDPLP